MRWRDDHSDSSPGLCLYTRARGRAHACGASIEELKYLSLSYIYRPSARPSGRRILQDPSARARRTSCRGCSSRTCVEAHRLGARAWPAAIAHVAAGSREATTVPPCGLPPLTRTWATTAGVGAMWATGASAAEVRRYFPGLTGPNPRTEDPQYPTEFVAPVRTPAKPDVARHVGDRSAVPARPANRCPLVPDAPRGDVVARS